MKTRIHLPEQQQQRRIEPFKLYRERNLASGFGNSPIEIMASQAMLRGEAYLSEFSYSAQFLTGTGTALGAGGTATSPIQINADSDFVAQECNLIAFTAADTPETNPDFLLTLVTAGSGRQLMNQAQHVMTFCGGFVGTNCLQDYAKLVFPILLIANTQFTVTLQNRSATVQNFVEVTFKGFKVNYLKNATRDKTFNLGQNG